MTRPRSVLAIDLGTQSLRVSVVETSGARLWSWSRPVDSIVDGALNEQDPRQWDDLLLAGIDAAAAAGFVPDAIAACGTLAGFVALDTAGTALTRAVMYNDGRNAALVDDVERALGPANRYPRAAGADPLPQWLRLRRDQPAIAAATRHFLDATGWLNFRLTGEATLNSYSALRLYTPAIRAALFADAPVFGRPVATGERIGVLSADLAARLAWPRVPVFAAPFDSKCAYLASGISEPGSALDISGTVTSFGVVANRAVRDPQRRIYSVPFGDAWLVRGSTAASGSVLEWAKRLLAVDFDGFDALVRRAAPGAGGVTLAPYLSGARAPLWQPDARGLMTGLSFAAGPAELARGLYEGLALELRHIVSTIESCGAPVSEIRLTGGLSRNRLLAQIKADVLGKPLVALAETELTTLGLVAIAATGLGAYPDHGAAARALVADGERFAPVHRPEYDAAFARYLAASSAAIALTGAKSARGAATRSASAATMRKSHDRIRSARTPAAGTITKKPTQREGTTP